MTRTKSSVSSGIRMRSQLAAAVGATVLACATHSEDKMPDTTPVQTTQRPQTEATRALIARLFAAYEKGDSKPLFDHVADDVHWTITGTNPLSGAYRSKREFLTGTYERLAAVLQAPVRPELRRIIADGDVAVVQWHGRATSIAGKPYDNDYCWIMRVSGDKIVEVTAYFDGGLVEELFRTTGH